MNIDDLKIRAKLKEGGVVTVLSIDVIDDDLYIQYPDGERDWIGKTKVETLIRYTYRLDKKFKPIYEGDWLKVPGATNNGEVIWDDEALQWKISIKTRNDCNLKAPFIKGVEIIGSNYSGYTAEAQKPGQVLQGPAA